MDGPVSVVERRRRNSNLPFASPQRARSWHPQMLRHVQAQFADLGSWEDFAGGHRRFANSPSRREAVGWARDTGLRKMCGCGLGR